MKSSFLRAGLALLCGVILSACGGGNGSLALSGTVTYTAAPSSGLVLVNKGNGDRVTLSTGQSTFVFSKLLATDEQFDVQVETNPTGAVCVMSDNKAAATYYSVYIVKVACTINPYVLGGTVKGLSGTGLVLANGSDTAAVLPPGTAGADVSFKFPTKVANAALYGVTVLSQPSGQTCTVSSTLNPGTMPSSDQLGLVVNCANNSN